MERVPGMRLSREERRNMLRMIKGIMGEEAIPVEGRAVFLAKLLHRYPHWLPYWGMGDSLGVQVN